MDTRSAGLLPLLQPCRSKLMTALVAFAIMSFAVDPTMAGDKTWTKSWMASPQPTWGGDFPLPTTLPFNLWNQTVRQTLRVSLGGSRFRIVLSNEYGKTALVIGPVHAARPGTGKSAIDPTTDVAVTFSGAETVSIPAGAYAISDPVNLALPTLGELTVSFHVAGPMPIETFHLNAEQTGFIGAGNQVSAPSIQDASETTARIFLSDIFVEASADTRTVVALGDSITDGGASGMNLNARWPDFLAEKLAARNVAVLNAGIAGGRLLETRMGENALARFSRDVLSAPNVKTLVVLIGINDIAWPGQAFDPNGRFLNKEDLIAGYRQLAAMAKANNIRIVVGTLTPFKNALQGSPLEGYYSDKRDQLRQQINDWIRTSGEFDAVVDLDRLVADPKNPLAVRFDFQADYLHMSPEGNKAIASAMTEKVLFGE